MKLLVGCYEQQVICYDVDIKGCDDGFYKFSQQFSEHSHTGCVRSVAAGIKYAASASTDESICLYDLAKNEEISMLLGHSGSVNSLQFAGDKHLISCSDDGSIGIWEAKPNGGLLKLLKGHKGPVQDVSVHPSGKLSMSVCPKDGTLRTWNMLTGRILYVKNLKKINAQYVRFSNDGSYYIIASTNCIFIYKMETATLLKEIVVDFGILSLQFLPDISPTSTSNNIFVIGSDTGVVYFYNVSTDGCLYSFKAHDKRVKCVHPFVPKDEKTHVESKGEHVVESFCHLATVSSSDERLKLWKLVPDFSEVCSSSRNSDDDDDLRKDAVQCVLDIATGARLTCVAAW